MSEADSRKEALLWNVSLIWGQADLPAGQVLLSGCAKFQWWSSSSALLCESNVGHPHLLVGIAEDLFVPSTLGAAEQAPRQWGNAEGPGNLPLPCCLTSPEGDQWHLDSQKVLGAAKGCSANPLFWKSFMTEWAATKGRRPQMTGQYKELFKSFLLPSLLGHLCLRKTGYIKQQVLSCDWLVIHRQLLF